MSGEWSWRLPFLLQMIPSTILGLGILFLPFSPRWLASKGRDDEALQSLGKLRQLPETDHRVQQEWYDIRAEALFHRQTNAIRHPDLQSKSKMNSIKLEIASWTDCFRSGCWRRTHIGIGLMFFQQFVGINALVGSSKPLIERIEDSTCTCTSEGTCREEGRKGLWVVATICNLS